MILTLSFPIELGLSNLSGKGYLHYFMSWLPILGFFTAWFVYILSKLIKLQYLHNIIRKFPFKTIFIFTLFLPLYINNTGNLYHIKRFSKNLINNRTIQYVFSDNYKLKHEPIINYINSNTKESDYILFWGNEVNYNFITGRDAPSKFTYNYMLFKDSYVTDQIFNLYINDLVEKSPLIIDTSNSNKSIQPIICEVCKNSNFLEISIFVQNYYLKIDEIGVNKWPVYQFQGIIEPQY